MNLLVKGAIEGMKHCGAKLYDINFCEVYFEIPHNTLTEQQLIKAQKVFNGLGYHMYVKREIIF